MKAVLVTYNGEMKESRVIVEISDDHNFADGPYADTVPFSVGSNQSIQPLEWHQDLKEAE